MSPATFSRLCDSLFGYGWAGIAADTLGVNIRNIQRMSKGDMPIPPGVVADLEKIARQKIDGILAMLADSQ
jgi:hypothetical protein